MMNLPAVAGPLETADVAKSSAENTGRGKPREQGVPHTLPQVTKIPPMSALNLMRQVLPLGKARPTVAIDLEQHARRVRSLGGYRGDAQLIPRSLHWRLKDLEDQDSRFRPSKPKN